mmetsp:Transcript_40221/g.64648  ORF Transcript_40221/g.64648 Transcript_40221/m.64648 type:complete len:113 (-) Transcript_40221:212-550(-)
MRLFQVVRRCVRMCCKKKEKNDDIAQEDVDLEGASGSDWVNLEDSNWDDGELVKNNKGDINIGDRVRNHSGGQLRRQQMIDNTSPQGLLSPPLTTTTTTTATSPTTTTTTTT